MAGDHFYTLDPRGELAPQAGYEREGTACWVFASARPNTVPLFRWFHPFTGDHFYTRESNGEAAPSNGYRAEGIACHVFSSQVPHSVALHRWYKAGDHFYTTHPGGELASQSGYRSEGIACWVYSSRIGQSQEFFRWFQSGMFANFTFDGAITQEQRLRTLERHAQAYFRAKLLNGSGALSSVETRDLLNAYRRPIAHGIDNNPANNASATIGGSSIWINFANLFPLGDDEIAQSLIHEMMHCAGYDHPNRQVTDRPNDGGAYFGSAPLRAELCIAGRQSDSYSSRIELGADHVMSCEVTKGSKSRERSDTKPKSMAVFM